MPADQGWLVFCDGLECTDMPDPIDTLRKRLRADECVILDGAIGTELQRRGNHGYHLSDDTHWGFDELHRNPETVLDVHSAYVEAGVDVLTSNTYSILNAPNYIGDEDIYETEPAHWIDMVRQAVLLPRTAIEKAGKQSEVAVAFSIGGDIRTDEDEQTIDFLLKAFATHPPDLVLVETLSMMGGNRTLATVRRLVELGWPVWVSFRRCRRGACGIHGELWGGPEGDRFGRLARDFEIAGAEALLINCLPISRIGNTVRWLRDFTDLPLGVYPNLGRSVYGGWQFADQSGTDEFVGSALKWRADGASLIGGCCGVGPEEISRVASTLDKLSVAEACEVHQRSMQGLSGQQPETAAPNLSAGYARSGHDGSEDFFTDHRGVVLSPLPLPKLSVELGVFMPTQGSYLIWKHLFREQIGNGKRCLDIGCGAGILAVQLAKNGASEVTAVDIKEEAVQNTLTNAFKNGVADRVQGLTRDLYSFVPDTSYDVIVASLYQMPTDPHGEYSGHRDVDYWGRNLLDHFIGELSTYLSDDGIAYVMQVSMLSAKRTQNLLAENGFKSRVVDFNLYQFNSVFSQNLPQIDMVERLSDAYHFKFDDNEHVMVMYLLEITRA